MLKVKVVPVIFETEHPAIKACWGSGGIAVSFMLRLFYPQGKSPWYSLDRRVGGLQSRCGRVGEEKISQSPPEIEPSNPDRPARSPALYRLSYHGCVLIPSWSQ
jgi:hypothetical protein